MNWPQWMTLATMIAVVILRAILSATDLRKSLECFILDIVVEVFAMFWIGVFLSSGGFW